MNVKGKVELDRKHLESPEQNGIPRNTKVGVDLKVIGDDEKELGNDAVIAGGFAWNTVLALTHESGTKVYVEGKGAQTDAEGKVKRFPKGHAAANKAVPNPGYVLDGPGISALEHSNGFRMIVNMKKLDEGYWTASGEVRGAGTARFDGDTFRVGKAKPRPGKGHK